MNDIPTPSTSALLSRVNVLSALSESELNSLVDECISNSYPFGETIIEPGDPCEGIYIVKSGSVRLIGNNQDNETTIGLCKPSDSFAEINALRNTPFDFTVRASSDCEILIISRAILLSLWERSPKTEKFMTRYTAIKTTGGLIARLFDLKGATDAHDIEKLIEDIGIKRVESGQTILQQDTCDDRRLYVIRQGSVRITRQEGNREYDVSVLKPGATFGEHAMLNSQNQPASAIAETTAILLVIPEQTVQTMLEYNPALRAGLNEQIQVFEQELNRQRKLKGHLSGRWHFGSEKSTLGAKNVLGRFPLIEQEEEMDCGAACLAMICRHFDVHIRLEQLRDFTSVDRQGATLESLADAGERLGFVARGISVTFAELTDFGLPFVAHWQGYHYVVVYGVDKHQIWIADPASGFKQLTKAEFEKGWQGTCLLLERDNHKMQNKVVPQLESSLSYFVKLFRPTLRSYALVAITLASLTVALPLLLQQIYEYIAFLPEQAWLKLLMLGWFAIYAFKQLADLIRNYLVTSLKFQTGVKVKGNLIQHLLYQPISFFDKRRLSDIFARFRDYDDVAGFVTEQGAQIAVNAVVVVICLIVLFFYDPYSAGILIVSVFPIALLSSQRPANFKKTPFNDADLAETMLRESFQEIETVKAQGAEYWMRSRWETSILKNSESNRNTERKIASRKFVLQLLLGGAFTFFIWNATSLYLQQDFTTGQLIGCIMIGAVGLTGLYELVTSWYQWQQTKPLFQRLQSIAQLQPEQRVENVATHVVLPELNGQIRIENLFFRYQQHDSFVIEGLNATVRPGEWVEFVGPRHSGKSTLSKLLMGFYPVIEGDIKIDGYPVNLVEKGSLRRQIGYASQRPALITGTLADNIALGIAAPMHKRMIDVCRLVDLDGFISQLPGGYEYSIAEDDEQFNKEQRQRLGLARALYRLPSILIIDQALSELLINMEIKILNKIRAVHPEMTLISFSERIAPNLESNQIFMIYNGMVAESGTRSELLEKDGLYRQLLKSTESVG